MQKMYKMTKLLATIMGATGLTVLAGCAPLLTGPMAEAGYNMAKTSFGGASSTGADERQKKLQSILNSVEIGQDVKPILEAMGEPPKEKSGNTYGFTCYQYASVYSSADAAVIMSKDGKVAFYGKSNCSDEMQDANFKKDGKYMMSDLP